MTSSSRGCLANVTSWLFAPCAADDDNDNDDGYDDLPHYSEKRGVYYAQPRPTAPPRAAPARPVPRGRSQQRGWPSNRVDDMGWLDKYLFSRRRRTTTRRPPIISHPTNFQHTGTGAVNFRSSARSFRPLELSIYETSNRVSPLLPYFIGPGFDLALPEPARTRDVFDDDDDNDNDNDDSMTLHSRSQSDSSFNIPRRPVGERASCSSSSHFDEPPPRIPPRAKTRPRAHTYASPSVEAIVERIASAIIEKDLLDAEIHSLKSRASMCLSRPSTAYDPDEPIPAFPMVPPSAPSFAERVSIDRPRTAPSTQTAFRPAPPPAVPAQAPPPPPRRTRPRPPPFPERKSSFKAPQWKPNQQPSARSAASTPPEAAPTHHTTQAVRASAFNSHPPLASPKIIDNSVDVSVPLAPPLPLILRPPLRKKKSFSRVSDWLFPADTDNEPTTSPMALASFAAHKRHMSIDSVTNAPRALASREEGFYQALPPSALFSGPRRRGGGSSFDSASDRSSRPLSESVYSTDEEQTAYEGTGTAGTVGTSTQWSPGSTPPEEVRRQADSWKRNEAGLVGFALAGAEEVDSDAGAGMQGGGGARRVPMHFRHASAPRPTSVGVAF